MNQQVMFLKLDTVNKILSSSVEMSGKRLGNPYSWWNTEVSDPIVLIESKGSTRCREELEELV